MLIAAILRGSLTLDATMSLTPSASMRGSTHSTASFMPNDGRPARATYNSPGVNPILARLPPRQTGGLCAFLRSCTR